MLFRRSIFALRAAFALSAATLLCFPALKMEAQQAGNGAGGFTSVNLWTANVGGYATYRIPGIVATKRGVILAYTSARRGSSDWADIDIVMRRSTDNGQTWGPSRRIAGDGNGTTDNPVAITDYRNGSVVFLYQHNYERCYMMRSFDDGRTFTKPVDITSVFENFRPQFDWRVIAPGVGHAIQLRSGRLLAPVWMALGARTSPTSRAHRPSAIATIYSDDDGKTWKAGDIIAMNSDELPNPSESMAVQLPDGRVYLSIRNESEKHRRAFASSPDGAHHWTKPEFADALYEPICAASIVRYARSLSDHDPRILFSNPDSENLKTQDPKRTGRLRQNLTLRLSSDGAKTWPVSRVIDAGVAGYSDIAVGRDKSVYVLYEAGAIHNSETDNAREVLAHFTLNWLLGSHETAK